MPPKTDENISDIRISNNAGRWTSKDLNTTHAIYTPKEIGIGYDLNDIAIASNKLPYEPDIYRPSRAPNKLEELEERIKKLETLFEMYMRSE